MMFRLMAALCCWVLSLAAASAPSIPLVPGQPQQVQFPGAGYSSDFFFDLPEGAQQFRIELNGGTASADLDMAIRFGTEFPDEAGLSFSRIMEYAHYHSISAEAREFMVVGPRSKRPARAGRWYVALINNSPVPTSALLRVDVQTPSLKPVVFTVQFGQNCPPSTPVGECFCDAAPWNDSSVGPAAPGNNGATLGQKRRNAFSEALRIAAARLTAESTIRVLACFDEIDEDGVLAAAGPARLLIDDSTLIPRNRDGGIVRDSDGTLAYFPAKLLPESGAHVSAAAATRAAGTDSCRVFGGVCNEPDVFINFNLAVDRAGEFDRGYYYGINALADGSAGFDFVAVAVHELLHGLGLSALVSLQADSGRDLGSKLDGRDDIYSRQVSRVSPAGMVPLMTMSNVDRVAAIRSISQLQWLNVETLAGVSERVGNDIGLRLHAPSTLSDGSSLSHLATAFNPNQLMEPSIANPPVRTLGAAEFMLHAVGWSPKVREFPQPQSIYTGLWFDPQRPGHGVDFQPINVNGAYDHALALFYSYSDDGQPEYYIATGPMVDGVFVPTPGPNGNALIRYLLQNGQPVVDSSSRGYMRIDFNDAARSGACQREGANSASTARRAAMMVMINDVATDWCIEPLLEANVRETPDRTGVWINGVSNDPGWGLSLAPYRGAGASQSSLFGIVYYHDGNGQPRWAFTQPPGAFVPGSTLPLNSISGYCRACTDNGRPSTVVGQLVLDLQAPVTGNSASLTVSYPGTSATTFQRPVTAIGRLSAEPRELNGN